MRSLLSNNQARSALLLSLLRLLVQQIRSCHVSLHGYKGPKENMCITNRTGRPVVPTHVIPSSYLMQQNAVKLMSSELTETQSIKEILRQERSNVEE